MGEVRSTGEHVISFCVILDFMASAVSSAASINTSKVPKKWNQSVSPDVPSKPKPLKMWKHFVREQNEGTLSDIETRMIKVN